MSKELKITYDGLKAKIDAQVKKAVIYRLKNDKFLEGAVLGKINEKPIINKRYKTNEYNPWLLEERHIAIAFGTTVAKLNKAIQQTGDIDILDLWNDYKLFKTEVLMHNDRFSTIRKDLAEYKLKLFDKEETITDPIIIKEYNNIDMIKQMLEESLEDGEV